MTSVTAPLGLASSPLGRKRGKRSGKWWTLRVQGQSAARCPPRIVPQGPLAVIPLTLVHEDESRQPRFSRGSSGLSERHRLRCGEAAVVSVVVIGMPPCSTAVVREELSSTE